MYKTEWLGEAKMGENMEDENAVSVDKPGEMSEYEVECTFWIHRNDMNHPHMQALLNDEDNREVVEKVVEKLRLDPSFGEEINLPTHHEMEGRILLEEYNHFPAPF